MSLNSLNNNMDFVTPVKRSKIMRSIKSKDTKPEIILRKYLYTKGLRYRMNYKKLPGRPDLVFIGNKLAVFIHGCFWHQHDNCKITNKPRSNTKFWEDKFTKNLERDKRNKEELITMGWIPIVIWECEILDINRKTRDLNPLLNKLIYPIN